jgi:hypothetical protein
MEIVCSSETSIKIFGMPENASLHKSESVSANVFSNVSLGSTVFVLVIVGSLVGSEIRQTMHSP